MVLPDQLNAEAYLDFMENDLPDLLAHLPRDFLDRMIYQHDGAPAHFNIMVRDYLDREGLTGGSADVGPFFGHRGCRILHPSTFSCGVT